MKPTTLRIRIILRGRLSECVATDFDGITLVRRRGATELAGEILDQAQLYGLLARIRDLGLELEPITRGSHAPPGPKRTPSPAARRRTCADERS